MSKLFTKSELDKDCVVCQGDTMADTKVFKLELPKKMTRSKESGIINLTKEVFVLKLDNPKNNYVNKWASAAMGREIRGNAILISANGITSEEVRAWEAKQSKRVQPVPQPANKPAWSALVKKAPDAPSYSERVQNILLEERKKREERKAAALKPRKPRNASDEEYESDEDDCYYDDEPIGNWADYSDDDCESECAPTTVSPFSTKSSPHSPPSDPFDD